MALGLITLSTFSKSNLELARIVERLIQVACLSKYSLIAISLRQLFFICCSSAKLFNGTQSIIKQRLFATSSEILQINPKAWPVQN